MPNGIFELPPFIVRGNRVSSGDDPFDPYGFNFNNLNKFDNIFDQYDNGGGGSGGDLTVPPPVITIGDGTPKQDEIPFTGGTSGDPVIDKLAAEEIARQNAIREKQGLPPLTEKTANQRTINEDGTTGPSISERVAEHVIRELPKVYEAEDAAARAAATATARTGAATGNSGIPLIIPISGIDPVTGLAITAAGLIFSGGNVAKLDPANPIQSVVNAGQGTIKTIGNVADVVTGQTDISDIWGKGSTAGAGSGSGAGAGAGTGSTAGTGSIVGTDNQVIGLDPAGMGTIAVIGAGGGSGTSQPPAGGGSVSVTPGALGGTVSIPGQGGNITTASTTPVLVPVPTNRTELPKVTQPDAGSNYPGIFSPITAAGTQNPITPTEVDTKINNTGNVNTTGITTARTELPKTTTPDTSTDFPGVFTQNTTKFDVCPAGQEMKNGACVPIVVGPPPITSCPAGQELKNGACVPIVIAPPPPPPPPGPTAVTPIVTPTFTFTAPTNTGLAQRDYGKEFGLTAQTLTGQPGDDLAAYYKKLQEQFTPSSLTTLGREAESQLAADMARYNEAQRGNLSAEDVRTAQQGAREAYAARGQVMGRGAIGAEILNRDALQRQREAEARASVQQSMGNLANAANLQTGNIFSPFASLISQTYSPTNQYAREVYDYNVNAYNAYQAAEKNLAAYKEAAAKGQEAQFINSFVGFLANNGIQTTTNAVTSILNGLLGGSTKKPGT